jgi:tetratricopeptide (TPR) repeat protein
MDHPLAGLQRFIEGGYDLDELRQSCFELGVDFDNLPGDVKTTKVQGLLLVLGRRRQLDRLLNVLHRARPEAFEQAGLGSDPATLEGLYAALPALEAALSPTPSIQASVTGPVSAPVAVGSHITQTQTIIQPPRAPLPPYTPPPPPDPDELPEPGPLPPGSRLPFHRNALFTGRVAPLKRLARALLHEQAPSALVTQAVHGMGGVGKTQLAVEFAYRYGRFFHGVHWLNAKQPEGLEAEVAACGAAMALPDWPAELPEQVARTLRKWRQGKSRLVILDNLEEVEAAREWLARLSGGAARLLLTARRAHWPRDLGLRPLRLELFSPAESRAFLREYLDGGRATGDELDALAERLGHLPLALELAGRYLEPRRLSVSAYVERLGSALEDAAMAGWEARLGSPTGHDLSLAESFAVSWREVTDEDARRLFTLAGYCAPNQPIPPTLLERAAGLDEEGCDAALGVLAGLGLLRWEEREAGPLMHPLLAEYARAQDEVLRQAQDEPARLLPELAEALAGLTFQANETGLPETFRPLRPHARVVAEVAEEEGVEKAATLWNNLGYHLQDLADYAGAKAAYEHALAIDEAVFGPEHPNVAIRVNNLGGVLRDLGDLGGARAAFERALAIDEALYGPDHPDVAIRANNLGLVLKDLGDLAGARAALERALAIDEAVYGPDHPKVAIRVNNLGSVLKDLGDLAGARAAFERALAIREKALGPDHPDTAITVWWIGTLLAQLGDRDGARTQLERALAIFQRCLPPDHPYIASVKGNLEGLGQVGKWASGQMGK